MPDTVTPVGFVGGGQMAEAIVGGMLGAKLCSSEWLWATDPVAARRDRLKSGFGIRVGEDNRALTEWADLVILAVKPQVLPRVLKEIGALLAGKVVVSIAAGVPIRAIAELAPGVRGIIRAMPNQPVFVREGMTALTGGHAMSDSDVSFVRAMFEAVGRVVEVDERLMDAVTGLSGSGPAYVFQAIEALADGGVKMGLPRRTAELLAAQTVLGAARMVLESREHPATLKDRVASPGGTTIAGLHRLEQGGFRATLMGAVEAATRRSEELGR
ncbi:MAG TPA: pyrroline-5-carboxylate reductase [Nitrospira sp.]|nr:pyrroline-5-carboxylate reductase [Nitrospira sp.]